MTKSFHKWAQKTPVEFALLLETLYNLENRLSSVDLGRGLYKVRVARKGEGKSGGYRTLIVYRSQKRAIFVYGFKKSEKDNLSPQELVYWQTFARTLLALDELQINKAILAGELIELKEQNECGMK